MSSATITPSLLSGDLSVPPSKSLLHRGLVCSALAGDLSLCTLPDVEGMSEDIKATRDCLAKMLDAEKEGARVSLFCGESGTTLRLLVPVVAALGLDARFEGAGRLPTRPLAEYSLAFEGHHTQLVFPDDGRSLPLHIQGKLTPGRFSIPGNISSQYISGLLLALPLLDGNSEILLTSPLESEPYVNMTLDVMRHFGVSAERTSGGYAVRGNQRYQAAEPYVPEPDFSQAAFWLLAGYLGNRVRVRTLPPRTSQGDCVFALMLDKLVAAEEGLCEIDVAQTPDLVPALAAAAAASPCETHIVNAARLRLKESDRLATTKAMLKSFGVNAEMTPDGLVIYPGALPFRAGTVDGCRDHRIVMAAAMMATVADGEVTITDSRSVDKSYPTFFNDFKNAGGQVHEFNVGE